MYTIITSKIAGRKTHDTAQSLTDAKEFARLQTYSSTTIKAEVVAANHTLLFAAYR